MQCKNDNRTHWYYGNMTDNFIAQRRQWKDRGERKTYYPQRETIWIELSWSVERIVGQHTHNQFKGYYLALESIVPLTTIFLEELKVPL